MSETIYIDDISNNRKNSFSLTDNHLLFGKLVSGGIIAARSIMQGSNVDFITNLSPSHSISTGDHSVIAPEMIEEARLDDTNEKSGDTSDKARSAEWRSTANSYHQRSSEYYEVASYYR